MIHRQLRAIARKLLERALEGDLQAIREIADRLDGKPAQVIERGDVPAEMMTDGELPRSGVAGKLNRPRSFARPLRERNSDGLRSSLGLIWGPNASVAK